MKKSHLIGIAITALGVAAYQLFLADSVTRYKIGS